MITIAKLRPDVIAENLAAIRELTKSSTKHEAAVRNAIISFNIRAEINELLWEEKEALCNALKTVAAQVEAIKYELLQLDKEIEILDGHDLFGCETERQRLLTLLTETENQLNHA